jgi:hypothetical protein
VDAIEGVDGRRALEALGDWFTKHGVPDSQRAHPPFFINPWLTMAVGHLFDDGQIRKRGYRGLQKCAVTAVGAADAKESGAPAPRVSGPGIHAAENGPLGLGFPA